MHRFAFRPLWLVSHLFAASLVVLFISLGFWQLRRHDDKVERNATIVARSELPPAPVADLVAEEGDAESLRFRPAVVEGEFVPDADLLVDNRSLDGLPGAWVLTPVELADGSIVAVNRGFQGFDSGRIDPPPPPTGDVTVEGTLVPWADRGCGVRTDDAGTPVGAACLRRSAVEERVGRDVLPVVLQLDRSAPADADVLVPVPLPDLDAGPHRSYAVQWFIFATIGLVGYPLVLRRVARDRAEGSVPDRADGSVPDGAGQ